MAWVELKIWTHVYYIKSVCIPLLFRVVQRLKACPVVGPLSSQPRFLRNILKALSIFWMSIRLNCFLHTWDRLSDISLNKMPLHYNRIYVYLEFLSCCNGLKLISSLATNMEGKTFFRAKWAISQTDRVTTARAKLTLAWKSPLNFRWLNLHA